MRRAAPPAVAKRPVVLIIDDDEHVLSTFGTWLQADGYDVRTACDGAAGLAQVQGVDAILLDARMPGLDGLGFLERLRAGGGSAPVAVITGDYLIDDRILDRLEHLDARIVFKPLWLEDLTELARSLAFGAAPA
ncbi:MAG TPA: response regulator [Vicinamibacterales bacterium]